MASIFTFETDIPRVSSPWNAQSQPVQNGDEGDGACLGVTRLEPEPQDGPVEYKLHLLLRPRRRFASLQTLSHSGQDSLKQSGSPYAETPMPAGPSPPSSVSRHARQHRFEQLTTQLLWRLQQSSTNHASSATNVILPSLPDASGELQPPSRPAKLINGLEESQGALYEIGVADDGTFVGLTEDEMEESLNNLRAMAACLGCVVRVTRTVTVGRAEWTEPDSVIGGSKEGIASSVLVVAEALVEPYLAESAPGITGSDYKDTATGLAGPGIHSLAQSTVPYISDSQPQLRVSLTGATLSGKSSLLGTLTTSALDNARGKSRLSMLKHRHEISSGLTSSVSQELVGYVYHGLDDVALVNYASKDVTTWTDVHSAAKHGRLTFLSDSAGHPRFRRTAVKGLVGWAPHWTLLCIPGNEMGGDSTSDAGSDPGSTNEDSSLSTAYLDLCLRLDLPLVVIVTKLDATPKALLRTNLTKILTILKNGGRQPAMLPVSQTVAFEDARQNLPSACIADARKIFQTEVEPRLTVPIVMTSAVQGAGIDILHALLSQLPHPEEVASMAPGGDGESLFHIEDIYAKSADPETVIVAGFVRYGRICVGDEFFLGPVSHETEDSEDSSDNAKQTQRNRRPSNGLHSRSFPGALRPYASYQHRKSEDTMEWRTIRVTSIRNLRLPVSSLLADQVGTVAFVVSPATALLDAPMRNSPQLYAAFASSTPASLQVARVRKGMVLLNQRGVASSGLTARFGRNDLGSLAVGSQVVLYTDSVRAPARVISACVPETQAGTTELGDSISSLADLSLEHDTVHVHGDTLEHHRPRGTKVAGSVTHQHLLVSFAFETAREYIRVPSQVLVMPGGGPGVFNSGGFAGDRATATLEGFVGQVEATAL